MAREIHINHWIDEQPLNRFHISLLFMCMLIIIADGYDMFMFGAIVPSLMKEWGIGPVEAGALNSYALIGMMIGAMIFGPSADRFGRKNVILLCFCLFSLFTFTSGFSQSSTSFGVQRFFAGLGLGGVMPNLIALMTEYTPSKWKSTLVSIMFSGHAFGGIIASAGAIYLIPHLGWRAVVWLGLIPLVFLPFFYRKMPESVYFYLRHHQTDRLLSVFRRLTQQMISDDEQIQWVENGEQKTSFPVTCLFREHRGWSTAMFWVSFFMCLLVMYGLSTWLPKIMQEAGYPLGSSLTFLVTLNSGAVIGAIIGGRLADLFGARKILILFFVIAFLTLMSLSLKPNVILLYILIGIAGGTTTGTQIVANSYVSQYYPTEMRSTGIGWALGVGRIGGIAGPVMGGILLNHHLSLYGNFLAFALPCLVSAVAIWLVQEKYSQRWLEQSSNYLA
ncbi:MULTISPECIES: MFS transporter [Geobacillus]|uniref:Aromatic acid/H+ symport family MFS transporter n=1 Tax=Geobacillus zalihae TaxID=213419 RepID=A0A7H1RWV2_9BACL|nr:MULTISPECIES: aromatic acid/H+ symport family MFS transporter [Geobacillus]ADU93897.1 major facilitator superfamily MFS_1 [Geobacillus sp. Y412MC52]AGE22033.1 4-hydroxybenzoate transporter [Geobacillus sp. GHH01]AMQ20380.1 MFS transporter [Geobacillus sp. JS12]OQP23615.1 MFS transporter [Geobacillus zalihae]QNU18741.1 aromatic acid/H+ symport family MFS transporter [Geobacillus zalihae]